MEFESSDSDSEDFEVPQYSKKPRQSVVANLRQPKNWNYVKRRSTISDFRKLFKETIKCD